MSSQAVLTSVELNPRQRQTVERVLDAGEAELREAGLDALTIRSVALRAGVSSATAYTYFDSKDHLFAQLFLRHLTTHPAPPSGHPAAADRLIALTRTLATDLSSAPDLAAAATRALLGTDPAVSQLRRRIGAEYLRRFAAALGDPADPAVLDTLLLAFMGALLQAGMGLSTYPEMAERLEQTITVIMRGNQ